MFAARHTFDCDSIAPLPSGEGWRGARQPRCNSPACGAALTTADTIHPQAPRGPEAPTPAPPHANWPVSASGLLAVDNLKGMLPKGHATSIASPYRYQSRLAETPNLAGAGVAASARATRLLFDEFLEFFVEAGDRAVGFAAPCLGGCLDGLRL